MLEERARIARDLHDGFIQALAGIDLRVEACKLHLQRDPARVPTALDGAAPGRRVAATARCGTDLTVLRTASRQADDFGSTLDRLGGGVLDPRAAASTCPGRPPIRAAAVDRLRANADRARGAPQRRAATDVRRRRW